MKIEQTEDNEAVLTGLEPTGDGFWISVGNASVYLKRTDEGLVVDVFGGEREDREALASCYVYDSELEPEEP